MNSNRLWVENCAVLDIFALPRPRPKVAPDQWNFNSPKAEAVATWADGSVTKTSFKLATTTPRLGGTRYWILCPSCGCRKGKLYATNSDRTFKCRPMKGTCQGKTSPYQG